MTVEIMRSPKLWLFLAGGGCLTVLVVGGILFITLGRGVGQYFFGKSFAEKQAREYISKVFGEEVAGIDCRRRDTDGNGYVSCDFKIQGKDKTYAIECAKWGLEGFINRGCKTRFPGLQ